MFYCWDHHNAILSPIWPCLSQFSFLLYSHKKMGEGSLCFSVHMPLIAGAKFNITRTSTIIAQGILHLCVTWWSHFHPSCFFLLKSNWAKSRARWKHEGRTEEQNKAFFLYLFFFFLHNKWWLSPPNKKPIFHRAICFGPYFAVSFVGPLKVMGRFNWPTRWRSSPYI